MIKVTLLLPLKVSKSGETRNKWFLMCCHSELSTGCFFILNPLLPNVPQRERLDKILILI